MAPAASTFRCLSLWLLTAAAVADAHPQQQRQQQQQQQQQQQPCADSRLCSAPSTSPPMLDHVLLQVGGKGVRSLASATEVASDLSHAGVEAGKSRRSSTTTSTAAPSATDDLVQRPECPEFPAADAVGICQEECAQDADCEVDGSSCCRTPCGGHVCLTPAQSPPAVTNRSAPESWKPKTGAQEDATCDGACLYQGSNYTCRERVVWAITALKNQTFESALELVNGECTSQCSCETEDFPPAGQEPKGSMRAVGASDGPAADGVCGTPAEDSRCHVALDWAMHHGIRIHPDWYPGLNGGSSMEEFQTFMWRHGLEECPRPCDGCHTSTEGEECHASVTALLAVLEKLDGHWESRLASLVVRDAVFKQLQEHLHLTNSSSKCTKPCGLCHTAVSGEKCHTGVMWAMQHGIETHPEWYPGLTPSSSFEDVQIFLHQAHLERCPMPCTIQLNFTMGDSTTGSPSTAAPSSTSAAPVATTAPPKTSPPTTPAPGTISSTTGATEKTTPTTTTPVASTSTTSYTKAAVATTPKATPAPTTTSTTASATAPETTTMATTMPPPQPTTAASTTTTAAATTSGTAAAVSTTTLKPTTKTTTAKTTVITTTTPATTTTKATTTTTSAATTTTKKTTTKKATTTTTTTPTTTAKTTTVAATTTTTTLKTTTPTSPPTTTTAAETKSTTTAATTTLSPTTTTDTVPTQAPEPVDGRAVGRGSFKDSGVDIDLEVDLSAASGLAVVRLTGPSNVWFGVGFGSRMMAGTYSIIVDGSGAAEERKLTHWSSGSGLEGGSLTQVSSEMVDGRRHVEFQRPLAGATEDHYSFDPEASGLDLILAVGMSAEFGYHSARYSGELELKPPMIGLVHDHAAGQAS